MLCTNIHLDWSTAICRHTRIRHCSNFSSEQSVTPDLQCLRHSRPQSLCFFYHVVGETEGTGSSNYPMSVNQGHPVTHAYFYTHICSCPETNPEAGEERQREFSSVDRSQLTWFFHFAESKLGDLARVKRRAESRLECHSFKHAVTSLSNILPMGFIVHFILIHFGLLDSDLLDRNLKSILTFGIPVSHLLSKWGVF